MDKAPKNVINVAYEGNNVLDEKSQGKENTPTQVRYQPLSITMPNMKDGLFYTLIMIDPDEGVEKPILHVRHGNGQRLVANLGRRIFFPLRLFIQNIIPLVSDIDYIFWGFVH